MSRFTRLLLLLLVMLALCLAACSDKEKEPSSSSDVSQAPVVDPNYPVAIGEIRIERRPKRIVSLSPALTEIICELGGRDRLTGISDYCDYPERVTNNLSCGTSALPDWGTMEEADPQIVFASAQMSQQDTIRLQQMGAEVVILPPASDLDGIAEIYRTIGIILDGMEDGKRNGEQVFAPLRAGYEALEQAANAQSSILGIYLRAVPLMMATGDCYEQELLSLIGVENAAAEYYDWEYPADQAVNLYPDLIFYDRSIDPTFFANSTIYNTTDAYKNNRMYPINALVFERQSRRMLEQLVEMFKLAHPNVDFHLDLDAPAARDEASASEEEDEDVLRLEDATQLH